MSKTIRLFLFLCAGWIFFSWGFRFYILWIRWGTDPSWKTSLFFGVVFFMIGGFLIAMGRLGDQATWRHYNILIASSLCVIGFWAVRMIRALFYFTADPNPRAHLHLAATYLVIGIMLGCIGWKGAKRHGGIEQ